MSATTIDQLQVEIESKSESAVSGIDALAASLEKLKTATKGGAGLTPISNQLTKLNAALSAVSRANANKLTDFGYALQKLNNISNVKISPTIANQITNIGGAVRSLDGANLNAVKDLTSALTPLTTMGKSNLGSLVNQLQKLPVTFAQLNMANIPQAAKNIKKLVTALTPLTTLGKSTLSSMINALQKIPSVMQGLQNIDMSKLTSQIKALATAFAPLASEMNKIAAGFAAMPSKLQKLTTQTDKVTKSNDKAAKSYVNLGAKLAIAVTLVRRLSGFLSDLITSSNKYIEDMNLFTVSMGKYAEEASKYAEAVSEALGIDPAEFMRNEGIFNTIIKGFGVVEDRAYKMSKNLTQLGYDISSFYNISFEDAFTKLQSGIAGELEPLRRLGYDLSVARLQQEAYTLGIEKKVSAMTQAEKAELRYYAIMTQVKDAQGDMARTLSAPANQLRVLQAQVTQCARAWGNLFIPVLNAVLPYVIALAKALRYLASAVANFFGVQLPEVDFSSGLGGASVAAGDIADSLGDAGDNLADAGKKAKKLKDYLLGIDELNVLSKPDDSDSSGSKSNGLGDLGGGGLGFDLPEYDFIGNAITSKVDDILKMLKDAFWEITAVVSGFLLAIGAILVVTGINIPLGVALMAIGAIGLAATVMCNWNGMSERLAKVLTIVTAVVGGFLLALGAILTFTGANVPLGIGLMIAGAVALATAVTINWKFLNGDLKNALSILTGIVSGALLAVGAIMTFTGANVPLGIALMVAGAVGLATAIGLNWDVFSEPMKKAIGTVEAVVGGGLLALGAILAFTGAATPLGIALMAGGAVALASAAALNWDALTGDLKESISTITAIVSGALIGIGAVLAFTGVATPLGIAMIAAGAIGIISTAAINWNTITEKVKYVLKEIGIALGGALLALGAVLAFTGVATPVGIALMVAGAASLAGGVALNWDSVTKKVKEVLKKLGIIVGAALLALGAILCFTGVALPLGIGLLVAGAASLAAGVALNWDTIVSKIKEVIKKIGIIVGGALIALGAILLFTGVGIPLGLALLAAGAASLTAGIAFNWDEISTKVKDGLKKVGDKFSEWKKGLDEKLDEAKETVKTWGSNVKEWFTKGKDGKGIIENLQDAGKDVVSGFVKGIEGEEPTSQSKIESWAASVGSWFKDKLGIKSPSTVFEGFGDNTVAGFLKGIETYTTVKDTVVTWASKVLDWFEKHDSTGIVGDFKNTAQNIITGFKDKVGSTYTQVQSNVNTWAKKVHEWYTNSSYGGVNSQNWQTYANNIITGFKDKVGNTYTTVQSNMQTWAKKVHEWYTNSSYGGVNSTNWQTYANNIITGFKDKVGNTYTTVQTNMQTWAKKVHEWYTSSSFGGVNSQNWQTYASNVITGFKDKIGSTYSTVQSNMTTWANAVKNWFTNSSYGGVNNSKFAGFAQDVISGFKDKISNGYTQAQSAMTTFANAVKGWFEKPDGTNTLVSKFKEIGANVIQGFIDGVNSLWDTAMKKIKSFGESIISKGKEGTEESSPSRAFKKIGAFVVEGFNIGIEDMIPDSMKVMEKWLGGVSNFSAPTMSFAVDTSALKYYDSEDFSRAVTADVTSHANISATGFKEGMEEFYKEYLQPTMTQIASDTKRQADKEEQTIVQVGNRVVTDAVEIQRRANGYRFVTT